MKRFKCLALDKNWRKCLGTVEAPDAESAKRQLMDQGYSVIQVREEVPEGSESGGTGKVIRNADLIDRALSEHHKKAEAESNKALAKGRVSRVLNQKINLLIFFIIGMLIATAFFLWSLLKVPEPEPLQPRRVVKQYFADGLSGRWESQFRLLSKKARAPYMSADHYRRKVAEGWPGAAYEDSERIRRQFEGVYPLEDAHIVVKELQDQEARVSVEFWGIHEKAKYIFFLVRKNGDWKIGHIRDVDAARARLRYLSGQPRQEVSRKLILEMRRQFGFQTEEIEEEVKERKIEKFSLRNPEAIQIFEKHDPDEVSHLRIQAKNEQGLYKKIIERLKKEPN